MSRSCLWLDIFERDLFWCQFFQKLFCNNLILKYSHDKFCPTFLVIFGRSEAVKDIFFETNIFTENGEPSWDFCTGNKGLYPWWNNCCYWNSTHCRPKTGKSYCSYQRHNTSNLVRSYTTGWMIVVSVTRSAGSYLLVELTTNYCSI